jgi:hypothetical protein
VSFQAFGSLVITDGIYDLVGIVRLSAPPATATAAEVPIDVELPAGAVVQGATLRLGADAAGTTFIGDAASVRAASGDPTSSSSQLVVDFGGMRTVSAVSAPDGSTIEEVRPWLGTSFGGDDIADGLFGFGGVSFTEVQTERLLVQLGSSLAPAALAAGGKVVVSTPPSDLEVLVDGVQAFIRPGQAPAGFTLDVEVGPALQTAVDAGHLPVPVLLRSRVAGQLSLEVVTVSFLETHTVAFPEGPSRTIDVAAEGPLSVALPLPARVAGSQIHRLDATFVAEATRERVLAPDGPAASTDAVLRLDPDHGVVARLPADHVARFASLTALRVLVAAEAAGAEVGGAVRGGDVDTPGDPLPGTVLGPVSLEAGPEPTWVTLPLSSPLEVEAGAALWADVQCTRGALRWPLAVPGSPGSDAELRRRLPNGHYRTLSQPVGLPAALATLRIAGVPPAQPTVDLLDVAIGGTPDGLSVTPAADPLTVRLGADPAVDAAVPGAFVDGALVLSLTAYGPCRLTVGPVVVAFTTTGGQT